MKLADFDYDLPPKAIATHPANPRDAARLLDLAGEGVSDELRTALKKFGVEGSGTKPLHNPLRV